MGGSNAMARSQRTVAGWSVSYSRVVVGSGYTVPTSSFMADNSALHSPNNVAASSRTKRRIVVTLVLLFIVATVVPFQFAYVVACVVQFSSCIKALNRTKDVILLVHALLMIDPQRPTNRQIHPSLVILQLHSLPVRPHDMVTPSQHPRPRSLGTKSASRLAHSIFLAS